MMSLFGKKIFIVFALMALITGVSAGVVFWIISDLPNINNLEVYPPIESSIIYSSDGVVLTELYIERRTFIPHYKIPDHIKKAFIAVEDQRFYYHQGVDIIGIVRALYRNITAKNIVEGGSTITQQLSKMLFLKPERNLSRKIKEAIISVQIERRYTKDEIVGMYLNQVYFGARAYGIESAAQTYFGKPSGELNIAETALLAGMPKAPSLYSPFKNPEKAFHRRELTLKKMLEAGVISLIEYHDANSSPLPARPTYRKFEAPYFIDFLRHQLEAKYSEKIYTTGYKIYSTIDYKMQKAAENAVARGISAVEKRSSAGVQAALVAIDYRNGHIKALVGGNDFWSSQYNRATMAMRQTGSA
ncbi:MAG: transglycosylase domain-containing protein, partial [Nitrospirae bacterium]|nr:transglycosylase domain-containing protein [Nitrospirota bacterium]